MLPPPPPPSGGELPPPPPPHAARRAPRRGWLVLTILAGLLLVALVGSMFVYVPYYAIAPGEARPTQALIEAEGVELFPSDGEVLFTTVSVRRLTAFGAVVGWLDDDVDVRTEREVLGDQTPEENRELNLRVMGTSKEVAEYVALTHLGYEVGVSGGGAVVTDVEPSVPAAAVLTRGDVITALDGQPVALVRDLTELLAGRQPGERIQLQVHTQGSTEERTVEVELAARDDGTAMIGVFLQQDPSITFDFPVELTIDSGEVGGPSAGLAFTLAVLDALTPGDLTGGRRVAVTGTINLDGRVGPIGGLRQKTVAVKQADADVFLVPEAEADVARAEADGDVLIVGVESLDDALAELARLGGNALALGTPGAAATPG